VSAAVQIPVIASGGAGSAAHFAEVFRHGPGGGKADAALAASIFHFGVTDSRELKAELQRAGVSVRLPC
jgi:cyclase